MSDQEKRIQEIRERANAATAGTWEYIPCAGEFWVKDTNPTIEIVSGTEGEGCDVSEADADFIANARQDIPYLLDLIESLQRERQEPGPLDAFGINHMFGKPVFSWHDGEWHVISEICSVDGDRIRVQFTDGESIEASEKVIKLYATEPKGEHHD